MFVLRANTYSYLTGDDSEIKISKATKKCAIKRILSFNDYENCLINNEVLLKSQQRFKSEVHNVYTEEVSKIALSSNDMKYSNFMQDIYKNIEKNNQNKKRKVLIIFDDMIVDMINNKKINPVVTELFIRGRKLNISIVFITQSYFKVPKDVKLNSTYFFIMKIQKKKKKKRELLQIFLNH